METNTLYPAYTKIVSDNGEGYVFPMTKFHFVLSDLLAVNKEYFL
jgi:hypothetical protein